MLGVWRFLHGGEPARGALRGGDPGAWRGAGRAGGWGGGVRGGGGGRRGGVGGGGAGAGGGDDLRAGVDDVPGGPDAGDAGAAGGVRGDPAVVVDVAPDAEKEVVEGEESRRHEQRVSGDDAAVGQLNSAEL